MDKKEMILEAAEELFAEKGFDATSIKDLSEKANINVAMVSYYFGSKEKLLENLIEQKAAILFSSLVALNQDSSKKPFAKLESLIEIYIERIFTNSNYHMIIQRELLLTQRSNLHENIIGIYNKITDEIGKILEDGYKQKVFKKVDVELIVATISGTISNAKKNCVFTRPIPATPEEQVTEDEKLKKRLKKYLVELLKAYVSNSQ